MNQLLLRYRARDITDTDIDLIKELISEHYAHGRSYISRQLCEHWQWVQPNGKLKEYAARDLLLRLEEKGFVKLPPRIKPKNNLKRKTYGQTPLFVKKPLDGSVDQYPGLSLYRVENGDQYLWEYLLYHYHYLGLPRLVGEYARHWALIDGQVVACLAWTSAAFKVRDRDRLIGWDAVTRVKRLHFIANNARFLIMPWIGIKSLASKVLALSLKRLNEDWLAAYGHPLYLAETFVDSSRFSGTCYKAANWQPVGHTKGSAKKGNIYQYHGCTKAIFIYPLHRHFQRMLADEQG